MRKILNAILFLGLVSLATACAPNGKDAHDTLTSINLIDRNGMSQTISTKDRLKSYAAMDFCKPAPYQKVMRVYRNESGGTHSVITSYHANGELKQYLEVQNGRAYGAYREYSAAGVLKLEAFLVGGIADLTPAAEGTWLFDGDAKAWDDEGHPTALIPYVKGSLSGVSVYYHPNGTVAKTAPYKDGKIHGTLEAFDLVGRLIEKTPYLEGKAEGLSERFWATTGTPAAEEKFADGKLQTGVYYDVNGGLISEITDGHGYRAIYMNDALAELQQYQNGRLEGEVKSFSGPNKLKRLYHIIDGIKDGEDIVYYDGPACSKPQPKMSVHWHQGKLQGTIKTWYDNGQIESQREISDNKKHGLCTAWYRDGNLMMIEEYEADRLKKGEYHEKGSDSPASRILDGNGVATLFGGDGSFLRKVEYFNGEPAR